MANTNKKKGLYDNMNARKKAGTSRSKANSTITDSAYAKMKKGYGFYGYRALHTGLI